MHDGSTSVIGELNLGGHKISCIGNPVDAQDAVSKSYMEALFVKRDSELILSTHKITNFGEPTNAQDVATRNYVDSALVGKNLGSKPDVASLTMRT
jgi:hypothetical protein